MSTDHQHDLPINDVDHAWTETRTYVDPISQTTKQFDVACGRCTCGATFESDYPGGVVSLWQDHRQFVGAA